MDEGDLVLGTVETVTNTVTHVRLPTGEDATIVSSEIAPGRIKHMRKYVTPHKKVVCKVLDASPGHIRLSLRRVTAKERGEVMRSFKQEQAFSSALKQLLGGDAKVVFDKIKDEYASLSEFFSLLSSDDKVLSIIPDDKRDAVLKIAEKRRKSHVLKQELSVSCLEEGGLDRIRKVLNTGNAHVSVSYVSAGRFLLRLEVEDFKEGKRLLQGVLDEMSSRASSLSCKFSSREVRS